MSKLPIHRDFDSTYLEYWGVLPIEVMEDGLLVAASGEPDGAVLDDLERSYGGPARIVETDRECLLDGIRRSFAEAESMDELVRTLGDVGVRSDSDGPHSGHDIRDLANQPPVIRFVNLLVKEAHEARATDVHLDASRAGLHVRFRIDGVLASAPSPPPSIRSAVVSRIKLIADLDIAERRSPQDGRVRVRLDERELDLRVSTIPTLYGESIVIRLLDHGGGPVSLEGLGMSEHDLQRFRRLAARPHGILLATGPTGSGKTTTLYAALKLRNASAEKIITVEDPVEYQLPGITQVPVNPKAGMSFAAGLRSILRQDPDVVMVGEMRDAETAEIAIQAAMTGHLVLSTLHTNDAVSAIARLVDLGVEPYLLSATLEGILAQRLVRRICAECVEEYVVERTAIESVGGIFAEGTRLRRGRGCEACRGTGFRTRTGVFELVVMDDALRRACTDPEDVERLRRLAAEAGARPIVKDGWRKVRAGITTVEEVARVVQV